MKRPETVQEIQETQLPVAEGGRIKQQAKAEVVSFPDGKAIEKQTEDKNSDLVRGKKESAAEFSARLNALCDELGITNYEKYSNKKKTEAIAQVRQYRESLAEEERVSSVESPAEIESNNNPVSDTKSVLEAMRKAPVKARSKARIGMEIEKQIEHKVPGNKYKLLDNQIGRMWNKVRDERVSQGEKYAILERLADFYEEQVRIKKNEKRKKAFEFLKLIGWWKNKITHPSVGAEIDYAIADNRFQQRQERQDRLAYEFEEAKKKRADREPTPEEKLEMASQPAEVQTLTEEEANDEAAGEIETRAQVRKDWNSAHKPETLNVKEENTPVQPTQESLSGNQEDAESNENEQAHAEALLDLSEHLLDLKNEIKKNHNLSDEDLSEKIGTRLYALISGRPMEFFSAAADQNMDSEFVEKIKNNEMKLFRDWLLDQIGGDNTGLKHAIGERAYSELGFN